MPTHPYISTGLKENKFGIPLREVITVYQKAARLPHLKIKGIACHIGSQILELSPFVEALESILELVDALAKEKIIIDHIDLGGGLGICYHSEDPPTPADYGAAIVEKLKGRSITLSVEPGRAIVANAGLLLTKVIGIKETEYKNFAVVDAGMNDLLRPALYEAYQDIVPVTQSDSLPKKYYDVVGPVCETGDFLGLHRALAIAEGDLLAVQSAGAYGFVMSSNYNTRPRAAEIMVSGDRFYCVRRRETVEELFQGESIEGVEEV